MAKRYTLITDGGQPTAIKDNLTGKVYRYSGELWASMSGVTYTPQVTPTPVQRTTAAPWGSPDVITSTTPSWTSGLNIEAAPMSTEQANPELARLNVLQQFGQGIQTQYPAETEGSTPLELGLGAWAGKISFDTAYETVTGGLDYTDPYGLSDYLTEGTTSGTIDATTKYLADLQSLYQMSQLGEAAELRKSDFVIKNKQLDIYEELGLGQLALEGKKANYAFQLGIGQIDLGYAQLDVQKLLGLGTIAVQREAISAQERMNSAAIAASRESAAASQEAADRSLEEQLAFQREQLAETKREFDLQHALDTLSTKGQLSLSATELLQNLTQGPQNWERYWYLSRGEGAPTAESQPAYDAVYNLVRQMSQWSFAEGGTTPAWTQPESTTPAATTQKTAQLGTELSSALSQGKATTPAWTQAYKQFRQPQYQWAGNQ